ncbi:hypothetical protein E2C01_002295 [Portunus trituberculatus]|uniref:Uncharacterized protein n=1 Tax=Portunus trituberculatus TaxID=210409 RepID=A0A5B7CJJ6_PORTR|nr:hypothetical protein [Portunus trituberculatus]
MTTPRGRGDAGRAGRAGPLVRLYRAGTLLAGHHRASGEEEGWTSGSISTSLETCRFSQEDVTARQTLIVVTK